MAIKIIGSTSGNIAEVDTSNQLKVALPTTAAAAGFAKAVFDDDIRPKIFSRFGTVSVGPRTLQFFDPVDGAQVNDNLWVRSTTTMTITQANGFISLNNGAITTSNTAAQITAIKQCQFINGYPLTVRFLVKTPNVAQTNATMEAGAFTSSGVTAPTDGVFFRWSSAGEFRAICSFGGVETSSAALTMPTINSLLQLHCVIKGTSVDFYSANALLVTVNIPAGNASPTSSSRFAPAFRVYTAGSAPVTAPELLIGACFVFSADLDSNKFWMHTMSSLGRSAYQSPVTAFGQTANFTNSVAPTSATLSNTAAGYTTLGGLWQFAAPLGAATDYALFGYQVPAGFQLHITRVTITSVNTGAAVATTATILRWGIAVNSSAVSLATADSPPTSFGPRRIAIGQQGWIVTAGIGVMGDDIDRAFDTAPVVDSGRFFHVIVNCAVGTATASQVISGTCQIEGYFE